jgi:hypothetical protein
MTIVRDAGILVMLVLLIATVRVTPMPDGAAIVPEAAAAQAQPATAAVEPAGIDTATTEPTADGVFELTLPFLPEALGSGEFQIPSVIVLDDGNGDARTFLRIEVKRESGVDAPGKVCPEDKARPRSPADAGAAC